MSNHCNYNPGIKVPEKERNTIPLNMDDFIEFRFCGGSFALFPKEVKHGS